jgi:hypothetical protein
VDLEKIDWYVLAILYGSLNKPDEAFALLEKAYSERASDLPYVSVDPMYEGLRSDPRFKGMLKRLNLSE